MACNNVNFLDINNEFPANATIQFQGDPLPQRVVLDTDLTTAGASASSTSATGNNTFSGNNTYTGTNTFNGNVALNGNTTIGNAPTDTLAFFGSTPVARPAALVQTYAVADPTLSALTSYTLTDSTTGTPSTAVEDVTATFDRTILNNNFADLVEAHNKLKNDYDDLAQFVNALTDRLQSLGLLA